MIARRTGGLLLAALALLQPGMLRAETRPAVQVGASYVGDVLANVAGGVRHDSAWLGRADLTVDVDGSAIGLPGVQMFVDLMAVHGPDFSGQTVGDAQVVSNVQADSPLRPFEVWVAAPVAGALNAKVGLIDLNSEFDVQSVGAFFLNSSHGIGPDFSQSGLNGPSIFPASAAAGMLHLDLPAWDARLGVFDAVAGGVDNPRRTVVRWPGERGALVVGEVDVVLGDAAEVQLGAWHYTSRFDRLTPPTAGLPADRGVSRGAYAMLEGRLWENASTLSLDAWVRAGVASAEVNPIGLYLGGGVTVGNDQTRAGLAFAHARLGDPAVRAATLEGQEVNRAETILELSLAHRLFPGVTLQPDLQYVINPGWAPARADALVAGVRLSLAFPE